MEHHIGLVSRQFSWRVQDLFKKDGRARTGLGADRLPVEVVVEHLACIVKLWCGAAAVVCLHNDLDINRDFSLRPYPKNTSVVSL